MGEQTADLSLNGSNEVNIWAEKAKHEVERQERDWSHFVELPQLNRFFLWSAATLTALGALGLIVPPVVAGVAAAVHPYTVAGRQELCLTHLQRLSTAFTQYSHDNTGFPRLTTHPKARSRRPG